MKSFKDFGIKPTYQNFTGDKIKMVKILNREILVHDYRIADSKFAGKCLYLQISIGETKHVVFSGSKPLIEVIMQIPKETGFPFKTTIIKENDWYEFT